MTQKSVNRPIPDPAPIIVALDDMSEHEAVSLARQLVGLVWGFKVNDLLLNVGADIVPRLKSYGNVFCDPKLYDIPNTVANQVRILSAAGADLITIHCSGGTEMMRAAIKAREGKAKLLGVTILTAMDGATCESVYHQDVPDQISLFAGQALEAGLDGIICAPTDLGLIDTVDPDHKLWRVTPGVRPDWHTKPDDQKRPMTPQEAWTGGAELLVIGRPITGAEDPAKACGRIVEELRGS